MSKTKLPTLWALVIAFGSSIDTIAVYASEKEATNSLSYRGKPKRGTMEVRRVDPTPHLAMLADSGIDFDVNSFGEIHLWKNHHGHWIIDETHEDGLSQEDQVYLGFLERFMRSEWDNSCLVAGMVER